MGHVAHIDDSRNLSEEDEEEEAVVGPGMEHHLAARDVISSDRQNAFVIKQRNAPKNVASGKARGREEAGRQGSRAEGDCDCHCKWN